MKKLIAILLLAISCNSYSQQLVSDSTFGTNGQTLLTGNLQMTMNTVLQQSDGKLIFCGNTYEISCNCYKNTMLRIDACGNIDSSFGVNGFVEHTFDQRNAGYAYALQPDGKIIAVGMQSDGNAGSQQFPFIARYKSNGTPDSSFATNGTNKISNLGPQDFRMVSILSNGKFFCANGRFSMRFNADGTVDNTYGNNGVINNALPVGIQFTYNYSHVVRPDGKVVAATRGLDGAFNGYSLLVCFDTTGTIDSTFGTNGFYYDVLSPIGGSEGPPLVCQSDNKVLTLRTGPAEVIIVRYNSTGSIDSTFAVNGFLNIPAATPQLYTFSLLNNDGFLIAYNEASGGGPTMKKFNADGVQEMNLMFNGSTAFDFVNFPAPQMVIASVNGELIIGGVSAPGANTHIVNKYQENSYVPTISLTSNVLNSNVSNTGATFQWLLNGNPISGATNSTLDITENGSYTVEVTNAWGCISSDDFTLTNVGIDDSNQLSSIFIYPNPTSDFITIKNPSGNNVKAALYEISGRLISASTLNTGENIFSLNDFANGIYIIELRDGVSVSRIKIVKH